MKFKVAIIGGGVMGLTTAYNIALQGECSVVVIEQGFVGSGSSTRNAAHFRVHFGSPENARFAVDSVKRLTEFASKTERDLEIHRGGYLWLLYSEEEVKAFKENNDHLWSKLGVAGKLLTPEEILERYPYLNVEGVVAGFLGPQDGKLNPNLVLFSYCQKVKDLGVRILTYTKAHRILVENNKAVGVQTDKGLIEAEKILVAAGAWTNELMKTANVVLPVEPERKEVGVTEPINHFIRPLIISTKAGAYIGQMLHGEIIGSIDYPIVKGLVPLVNTLNWFKAYVDAASEIIPLIKHLMFLRSWAGYYAMTPDQSHILGREPRWPENLYVATGFSGHGFTMSHYAGEVMAKYILYDKIDDSMKPFLPTRFEEGKLIKESLISY